MAVREEKKMKRQQKRLSKELKVKQMRNEHKEKKQNKEAIEEWKREIKEKGTE